VNKKLTSEDVTQHIFDYYKIEYPSTAKEEGDLHQRFIKTFGPINGPMEFGRYYRSKE
jgi:hypothetical protein